MLISLAFAIADSLGRQARAFTFLSYQDTVFAVYVRGWSPPTRDTELTQTEFDLKPLGMEPIKGTFKGKAEGWDASQKCYNVACADFEHVMACSVNAQYLRPPVVRNDLKPVAKAKAMKLLQEELNKLSPKVTLNSVKEPNVYSVDLDGTKHEEILVDISAQANGHNYGLAFIYSQSMEPTTLLFRVDGWPRILSVVGLGMDRGLDRDLEEIIVGGTTSLGKCVRMYKFARNKIVVLAGFDSVR